MQRPTKTDADDDRGRSRGATRRTKLVAGLAAPLLFGLVSTSTVGVAEAAAPSRATPTAPRGRVDLATPKFSNPTAITNPLFPISRLDQAVQLGHEGDEVLRHEITLLPGTQPIRWNGKDVETLVSQFVAYGDGRILEVAVDYFAQADDGSVWYFGEDVANYVDGVVDNHDGTWRAGRDGPPGMIMPAHPRVGDVYRPENIPGVVFEEVTVKAVDQTVDGPRGRVRGAIRVRERPMDGVLEDKVFAPGYGEFEAHVPVDDELVTVAVAYPTDRLGGSTPRSLRRLTAGAGDAFDEVADEEWSEVADTVDRMDAAWEAYQARNVPDLLEAQMDDAFDSLVAAVEAEDAGDAQQAAVEVELAGLDLQSQYRTPPAVDDDRVDAWERQLSIDEDAGDEAGIASDEVIIGAIEDRSGD